MDDGITPFDSHGKSNNQFHPRSPYGSGFLTLMHVRVTRINMARCLCPQDFTAGGQRMSELSMVLYNNLLSVPLLFVLAVAAGELPAVLRNPYFWEPRFQAASALGGALGFGISFASLWFISISSATFVCLAGSMNKVIVAAAGITAFGEPATARSFASISLGVMAGIALGFARQRH